MPIGTTDTDTEEKRETEDKKKTNVNVNTVRKKTRKTWQKSLDVAEEDSDETTSNATG
jgi:hypothetical protein